MGSSNPKISIASVTSIVRAEYDSAHPPVDAGVARPRIAEQRCAMRAYASRVSPC